MGLRNSILDYKNLNLLPASENKDRDQLFNRYFIDHLTHLPNIYQIRNDLEDKEKFTLIVFSIDNIQTIKDFYGYVVGDYAIEEIAEYLKKNIADHKVYRLSADEFAFVVDKKIYFYDLKEFLDDMYENMKDLVIKHQNRKIYIDFTLSSSASKNNINIFSKVSMALKHAKDTNSPYWIYEDTMKFEENYANNLQLSDTVREAIVNLRVIPYYQAIINTETSKIQKYECLARLIDSNGKIVSPLIFIPISKQIKTYNLITKTIIDQSFSHFESIECEFTINLSIEDIVKKEMYDFIMNKLRNSKVSHKVTFEILESDAIEDFEKVERFINEIRRHGAKIAIDDFGSGYSNFSYLTKLNADYIKIDGSLIKNMDSDHSSFIIVETIVEFAKKLGIKTVAEYVHSNAIMKKVKELNIDFAQGYYIGKPSMLTSSTCETK